MFALEASARSTAAGQDITIPANTQITTLANNGPVFLTSAAVLPAAASQQSVAASSIVPGAAGNAPAGIFVRHNFSNYTDSGSGTLLVTNQYGVTTGRDAEDDESYRYRINLRLKTRSSVNEAALRFELLQVPGVQDVAFVSNAGSFYAYLYGISPSVSPQVIQTAQAAINETVAFPSKEPS